MDRRDFLVRHVATEDKYGRYIRDAIKQNDQGASGSRQRQEQLRESFGSCGTFGGKHPVTASAAWLFTMMNDGNLPTEQQLRLTAAYASSHRYCLANKGKKYRGPQLARARGLEQRFTFFDKADKEHFWEKRKDPSYPGLHDREEDVYNDQLCKATGIEFLAPPKSGRRGQPFSGDHRQRL